LVARDIFLAGQAKITGPTLFGGAAMLPTQVHGDILASFARLFPAALVSSAFLAHCFVIGELPRCYWSSPSSSKCISFPAWRGRSTSIGGRCFWC
jgi:hypothetical protein